MGLAYRGVGRCGCGGGAVAAIERALLVAPLAALGLVDRAVVVGVDALEAFLEAAVARRDRQTSANPNSAARYTGHPIM